MLKPSKFKMPRPYLFVALVCAALLGTISALSPTTALAERIKDIAMVEGARSNQPTV